MKGRGTRSFLGFRGWFGSSRAERQILAGTSVTLDSPDAASVGASRSPAVISICPYLPERMREIGSYWAGVHTWLIGQLVPDHAPAPAATTLVGLLLSFSGWQVLVRQQQLTPDDAKRIALDLISTVLWQSPLDDASPAG